MRNLKESTRNRKFCIFYLTWIKVSPSHKVWNMCSRAQYTNEYQMKHTFFFVLSDTYTRDTLSRDLANYFAVILHMISSLRDIVFSCEAIATPLQIKDPYFVNKISFVGNERRKPSRVSRDFPDCPGFSKAVSNAAGNILTLSHGNSFPLKSLKWWYGKQPDGE